MSDNKDFPARSQVHFGKSGHQWAARKKAREMGRYYTVGSGKSNNVYDCWSDAKVCKVSNLVDDRETR